MDYDPGRDDVERDLADGLLHKGFKETAAYNAVATGRKTLAIGRKGAGKSAICRRLASQPAQGGDCELVTAADIAGKELLGFELAGLSGDHTKSLLLAVPSVPPPMRPRCCGDPTRLASPALHGGEDDRTGRREGHDHPRRTG
ncbi:hypothetical protein [Streptomyces fractus]|uniref:hypothetical protein n=1 Tax=Streptomyces fractus TaxID=641806 RepID=UPI003CF8AED9